MLVPLLATVLMAVETPPLPTPNVADPARLADGERRDHTLPFLHLEPHAPCLDVAGPLTVTVVAVNRSDKPLAVDWTATLEALHLEPLGPGTVGLKAKRPTPAAVTVPAGGATSQTFDLTDCFTVTGGSVYRLSAARPLPDGRLHVAPAVRFTVEDLAAVRKLAEVVPASPARELAVGLLRNNHHFFAGGGGPKLDRHETWIKPPKLPPELTSEPWTAPLAAARVAWADALPKLLATDAGPDHLRALEVVLDRLLAVSDGLRVPPQHHLLIQMDRLLETNRPAADRERVHLKLARCRDHVVAGKSISRLMEILSPAAPEVFMAVADGPDKHLAHEALGSLGNFQPTPAIVRYLRRKMADPDPKLALNAAIVTCYSGDWSGFPMLLRCAGSPDPALMLDAVGQLGGSHFREHQAEVLPVLLAVIAKPPSDELLERAIESLAGYPGAKTVEVLTAHLGHKNPQVSYRAKLGLDLLKAK